MAQKVTVAKENEWGTPFHEDLFFGPSGNVTIRLFMISPSILIGII